jgi:hypothetical protein
MHVGLVPDICVAMIIVKKWYNMSKKLTKRFGRFERFYSTERNFSDHYSISGQRDVGVFINLSGFLCS